MLTTALSLLVALRRQNARKSSGIVGDLRCRLIRGSSSSRQLRVDAQLSTRVKLNELTGLLFLSQNLTGDWLPEAIAENCRRKIAKKKGHHSGAAHKYFGVEGRQPMRRF